MAGGFRAAADQGRGPPPRAEGKRGRIGFLGVNSLAHVECWLGVPASGRVLVDLNFRLAEAELAFMVDDRELELLVVDAEQLEVARVLRARCASLRQLVFDGSGGCPEDCIPYEELIDIRTEPLPRSAAGKLLKNVLREPFWAGRDRSVN
jgi:long-chain acyl-CoA synthetase